MKVSGKWVLYILVGIALIILNFSCCGRTTFSVSDVIVTDSSGSTRIANRKLKENSETPRKPEGHNVNLEDYRPIDPVPSSKASIKPGPIEHGTPLNPFIPKPAPPSPGHPKNSVLGDIYSCRSQNAATEQFCISFISFIISFSIFKYT